MRAWLSEKPISLIGSVLHDELCFSSAEGSDTRDGEDFDVVALGEKVTIE